MPKLAKVKSSYQRKYRNSNAKYGRKRRNYRLTKTIAKENVDTTTGLIKSIPRELGMMAGTAVGGPLGGMLGGALGGMVDRGISYFTGRGAYQVKKNLFINPGILPPIINKDPSGGVVIRRCEYITDVISPATPNTFSVQSYYINPGLSNTFQWLSQVASNFEEWTIEGMYFEYRSMSADALNSTNTALGQVILAADYNSADAPFASKQEMENYEGGISVKPSQSVRFFVECAKKHSVLTDLYIRTGSVPSGQDQRLYDLANFQLGVNGCQGASVNLGELWVCYQISLRKPRMYSALGNSNLWCASSTGSYGNATPFGTQVINDGNLALTFTSTTITFPYSAVTQSFYIQMLWFGTGGGVVVNQATVTASTGIIGPQRGASVPTTGETATKMSYSFEIQIPANNLSNVLTIGAGGTYPGGTQSMYIVVNQMPNLYFNLAL